MTSQMSPRLLERLPNRIKAYEMFEKKVFFWTSF